MQVAGTFNYLGLETFQGKKDPTQSFANLALLQGTDVTKVFLDADGLARINSLDLKPMSPLNVVLKITIGIKTYVSLVNIELIK